MEYATDILQHSNDFAIEAVSASSCTRWARSRVQSSTSAAHAEQRFREGRGLQAFRSKAQVQGAVVPFAPVARPVAPA